MVHVSKNITIKNSPEEVYRFWRHLENLPRFMHHLEDVRVVDEARSHWVVNAPGGRVEWDAEITEDVPSERLAWHSSVLDGYSTRRCARRTRAEDPQSA